MQSFRYLGVRRLMLGILTCCTMCVAGEDAGAQGAAATPSWTKLEDDLRIALQGADAVKIRELIAAGANVNARDVLGGNAMHVAVNFRGDLEVMKLLVDRGVNVNTASNDGNTPLLTALRHALYKHESPARLLAVVEFLLARGASVNVTGSNGETPVRAAMDPVNLPLLRLLIKHGAALPDDGLDWAVSNDYVDLARLMMDLVTPGMLSFKSPDGGTLLHRAAAKPRMVFVMQWLVKKGADIHALDTDGNTPFGSAAFFDNIPGMAYLQGLKANMATQDNSGHAPLHLAAYGARHDVMRWLIERGADIKARDKKGHTPLEIAIDSHRFAYYSDSQKQELVTMLGGTPADIARGRFSNHPLHEATNKRDLAAVRRLLEGGANPNVKSESGNTPLYWAIALSSGLPATPAERDFGKQLLPLLIRHGADTTMLMGGTENRTYEQYARSLRIGDLLERTKEQYAPRGGAKGR